jgi:hypothetical protein
MAPRRIALVQTIVVHSEFLGRLDQAPDSVIRITALRVLPSYVEGLDDRTVRVASVMVGPGAFR